MTQVIFASLLLFSSVPFTYSKNDNPLTGSQITASAAVKNCDIICTGKLFSLVFRHTRDSYTSFFQNCDLEVYSILKGKVDPEISIGLSVSDILENQPRINLIYIFFIRARKKYYIGENIYVADKIIPATDASIAQVKALIAHSTNTPSAQALPSSPSPTPSP